MDHTQRFYETFFAQMPKTDRSLLIPAIVGLICTSFGLGSWATWSWSKTTELYPRYIEIVEKQEDSVRQPVVPNSFPVYTIKRPCQNPSSREESELCAQWQSANASANSDRWAFLQLYLSLATVLGLGITLLYNRYALMIARTGNALARQTGEAQLRAYFSLIYVHYTLPPEKEGDGTFTLHIRNNGATPALKFRQQYKCFVANAGQPFESVDIEDSKTQNIGPTQDIEIRERRFKITSEDVDAVRSGRKWLYIIGTLEFETVYQRRCRIDFGRHSKIDFDEGSLKANGKPVFFTSNWEWRECDTTDLQKR